MPAHRDLKKEDKDDIVRRCQLDSKNIAKIAGTESFKNANGERVTVSRATIYLYLKQAREGQAELDLSPGTRPKIPKKDLEREVIRLRAENRKLRNKVMQLMIKHKEI
jgi:transposase-like protein